MKSNLKSPDLSERRETGSFLLFTIFAILMFKGKLYPRLPTEPFSMPCVPSSPYPTYMNEY